MKWSFPNSVILSCFPCYKLNHSLMWTSPASLIEIHSQGSIKLPVNSYLLTMFLVLRALYFHTCSWSGTNFCFKKCIAVIAMQLEDCIALSAVCVAVSFCMLWGLKCERPATDHTIMKNANANIQYFAVLMTTWQVLNKIYVENEINVSS